MITVEKARKIISNGTNVRIYYNSGFPYVYYTEDHAIYKSLNDAIVESISISNEIGNEAVEIYLDASENIDAFTYADELTFEIVDGFADGLSEKANLEKVLGFMGEVVNVSPKTSFHDIICDMADALTISEKGDIAEFIAEHMNDINETINDFGWEWCDRSIMKACRLTHFGQLVAELALWESKLYELAVLYYCCECYSGIIPAYKYREMCDRIKKNIGTLSTLEDVFKVVDEVENGGATVD